MEKVFRHDSRTPIGKIVYPPGL